MDEDNAVVDVGGGREEAGPEERRHRQNDENRPDAECRRAEVKIPEQRRAGGSARVKSVAGKVKSVAGKRSVFISIQRFRASSNEISFTLNFVLLHADMKMTDCEDESNIGLCRALESLRQPLCFDVQAGNWFGPREHPARLRVTHTGRGGCSTAM